MVFNCDRLVNERGVLLVVGKFKGVSKSSGQPFFALTCLRSTNVSPDRQGLETFTQFVNSVEEWGNVEIGTFIKRSSGFSTC